MAIRREAITTTITPTNTTTTPAITAGDSGIAEAKQNKGGVIGGIAYMDYKLRKGVWKTLEGIPDYIVAGVAKLFGFDKFAERQFQNSWSDNLIYAPGEATLGKMFFGDTFGESDEWFNAGGGWKTAGDVAGGIGTSVPAIVGTIVAGYFTGGLSVAAQAAIGGGVSFGIAGLGAAGNATQEAYQETGKLTGKEFGYGALTGATEGGLEGITNAIGVGSGAIIKAASKSAAKGVAKSAVRKGIGITMAESFAGEAFEEGVSEALSGVYKRATYDPNARNATADEIAYAAFVGGLSGVLMGGGASVYSSVRNTGRGNEIVTKGNTNEVLALAREITAKTESENLGDIKQFAQVEATYKKLAKSLEKTNGEVKTLTQKRLLGELEMDNIAATFAPKAFNEAARVVTNADMVAQAYSRADENGKKISYTKEQLLEGVDLDNLRESLPKALETNQALREVVFASMAGEMMMDATAFQNAVLNGEKFAGEADLSTFLATATEEEIREVEKVLGIDNLRTVDAQTFNAKVEAFRNSPQYETFFEANKMMKSGRESNIQDTAFNSLQKASNSIDNDSGIRYAKAKAKYIPYSAIGKNQVENVRTKLKQLYSDIESGVATEIAIESGNTVYIVDSGKENGKIEFGFRKKLTISDKNLRKDYIRRCNNDSLSEGNVSDGLSSKFRSEYDNGRRSNRRLQTGAELSTDKRQPEDNEGRISQNDANRRGLTSTETKPRDYTGVSLLESSKYARENVKEYKTLDSEGQARIRRLIRQMKAHGFTDAQITAYSRVAARSGIDIVISKDALQYKNTKGETRYADGMYSPLQNKIYVNPEGKRSPARLLIHELTHAIYKDSKGKLWLDEGALSLSSEEKARIVAKYFPDGKIDVEEYFDEVNAHYIEALLDDESLLQKLCDEHPTLEDKIVSFLTGAKRDYADTPTLSKEAKKLYKRYKTLFDSFAERNQYADVQKQGEDETKEKKIKISDAVDKAIANKGDIGERYNQKQISKVPKKLSDIVSVASQGKIDISEKYIAINGSNIWHEFRNHGNPKLESERLQVALTPETIKEAIEAIYSPDIVESIFNNTTTSIQQQSFAYVKKTADGHYIVVETVGGKNNPNIVPTMILEFTQDKWNSFITSGKSIGELIHENNSKLKNNPDALLNKNNRVIVAQFTSKEAIANTPHSPRFNNSIPQSAEKSTVSAKKSFERSAISDADANVDGVGENVNTANIASTNEEASQANKYASVKVNTGILSLIDKVKNKLHKQNEKIYLSNVSSTLSQKIFELTGIDTTGFRVAIEARQIDHILKDHGENGKTDQSMKDPLDIAKIEYAISEPDSIVSSEKVQGYSYMKDGKNRTAPSVLYEKEIGRKSYYVVQAVPDTKAKTLYIVSAFIGKKGYKKGASQLIDTLSPDVTSKNGSVVTPNNSIPQDSEIVNSNSKKSSDRQAISDDDVANYKNVFGESGNEVKMNDTDEDIDELDTSENVGKKRKTYKLTFAQKFFSAKDSAYIELVDEMYGVAKYLKKVGKIGGRADNMIQAIRASRSAAQTMISDKQIDLFGGTDKELGEGLLKIIKPITMRGEKVSKAFDEYLLHWLNVDRMSLREKSLAELAKMQSKLEADVAEVREINELLSEGQNEKTTKELKAKRNKLLKEIKAEKKQIDNFEVAENKPIFGENDTRSEAITAEQSRKKIAEMDKEHPSFKAVAEKMWKYTKNLNHMRQQAGLISAEAEARMAELYPHYVPAFRDFSYSGVGAIRGKSNLEISSTVKRAKGSGLDILDVADSIAMQTQEVMRAGRINQLFNELYNTIKEKGDSEYAEIVGEENISPKESEAMQADSIELKPKSNQITGYVNGKKVTLAVSREIFIGFESVGKPSVDPNNKLAVGAQKVNEFYKKLITSFNPGFAITNPIKDLQDAGLNSKHGILFGKNLPRAAKLMYENSKEWQLYRAYGGYSSSIFNTEGGFTSDIDKRGFAEMVKLLDTDATTLQQAWGAIKNGSKNIFTAIENANAFVEQMTRFTEFLASLEAGDSIDTAIYNSAEVTTNFGRRGRTTKVYNATIMPFLNPSIQGFDKMIRNVTDAFKSENVAKAFSQLFTKAALIGIAPMVINMLLWGGDDDYEDLRETDKENYFLIRISEGKFIKIPRGRVASIIGGAVNRTTKLVKGEDADIKDYLSNVMNQVTPVQNFTRTIFSPFFDARNNRTWYGGEIEGREWDNTTPKDRYDESTSSIAVGIGKVTGWSPKKIHYVLDQYSGVIGDFILPATTKKAERGFLGNKFILDSATSNKLSSEFYELYDKAQYAKTAGDDAAIYQVKYLNKVKSAIGELHDEKSKVQNDSTLTSAEKLQKTRVIQILINEAYKTALADYELYTQAIQATEGIENTEAFKNMFEGGATEENIQKMRYTESIHLMYGAERALKEYNSEVYEKSKLFNLAGVDYETFYNDYFTTKGITSDTDKKGNVISGSKRKKIVATISAMKIPTEQKLLLIASKGYSLQDGDIRGLSGDAARRKLLNYILNLKLSKEERIRLAELCGFEVVNGKIKLK